MWYVEASFASMEKDEWVTWNLGESDGNGMETQGEAATEMAVAIFKHGPNIKFRVVFRI